MNWKKIFSAVENMDAVAARKFIESHQVADYQLLDVRQPKEYDREHLPGAMLIPLAELPQRLNELDRDKKTIVYCAVGGRSRAAGQLLNAHDFTEIYNLSGGIKAWHGQKAIGPETQGLQLLKDDAEFDDAISLAYAMEDGLQQFYVMMAAQSRDSDQASLFSRLAGIEDKHKARLLEAYNSDPGKNKSMQGIMEGGADIDDFLESARPALKTADGILDLAMMLETQALDLYSRLAKKSNNPQAAEVFLRLADEEKAHLKALADEMDKLAAS